MYDVAETASQFRKDGFVLVKVFFSRAEVDELDQQLRRYIRELVPHGSVGKVIYESGNSGPIKHIGSPNQCDEYFQSLLTRPATIQLVEACVGTAVESTGSEVFYKPALVGSPGAYHQDNAYSHCDPAEGAVVWIAIEDDTTIENGALHYARGSHKAGNLPHHETNIRLFSKALSKTLDPREFPEVPAILKRGDASIHHFLCAYRSGPNHTQHMFNVAW